MDMPARIEMGIVTPTGRRKIERGSHRHLTVAIEGAEALAKRVDQLFEERRGLQYRDSADVQQLSRPLQIEKRRVERRQPIVTRPDLARRRRRACGLRMPRSPERSRCFGSRRAHGRLVDSMDILFLESYPDKWDCYGPKVQQSFLKCKRPATT